MTFFFVDGELYQCIRCNVINKMQVNQQLLLHSSHHWMDHPMFPPEKQRTRREKRPKEACLLGEVGELIGEREWALA